MGLICTNATILEYNRVTWVGEHATRVRAIIESDSTAPCRSRIPRIFMFRWLLVAGPTAPVITVKVRIAARGPWIPEVAVQMAAAEVTDRRASGFGKRDVHRRIVACRPEPSHDR